VRFETDVENGYFDRATDRGSFKLAIVNCTREVAIPSYSLTLEDGFAHLNLAMPPEKQPGDQMTFQTSVYDTTLAQPFISLVKLTVTEKQPHSPGQRAARRGRHSGGGDTPTLQGIELPEIIRVRENDEHWNRHNFDTGSACKVISDPVEENGRTRFVHTFYINVDNISLKTEAKYSKQDPRLLEAKFVYGNVLFGLGLLNGFEKSRPPESAGQALTGDADDEPEFESMLSVIERVSSAVAPVLLPIIDQLSGLNEEDLAEFSSVGEDA
jgi:hypothetical protein